MSHEQETKAKIDKALAEKDIEIEANVLKEASTKVSQDTNETIDLEPASPEENMQAGDKEREAARQRRLQESKALLEKLSEVYPAIFPHPKDARPVPLAIGLHKELQPIVKEWGFSAVTLRSALAWYTKQLRYQKAVLHSEHRKNLDGTEGELILESHKTVAKENIARIEAWLLKHKPKALTHKDPRKEGKRPKRKPSRKDRVKSSATHLSSKKGESNSSQTETPQSLDDKMRSLLDKFNN